MKTIDGSDIFHAYDLAAAVEARLTHSICDDSFDHAFGTHHQYHAELDQIDATVAYPPDRESGPWVARGTYKGGGCDGEHRGRCGRSCIEVEIRFALKLDSITRDKAGQLVATYDVEQLQ